MDAARWSRTAQSVQCLRYGPDDRLCIPGGSKHYPPHRRLQTPRKPTGTLSPEVQQCERETDHLHPVPNWRLRGVISPLPCVSSGHLAVNRADFNLFNHSHRKTDSRKHVLGVNAGA